MSTQKRKFELFAQLQALGFTYDESVALRRIEMTLQRWAELECGNEQGRCIERAEARKLAIWHDPEFPDGLRVVALDYNGRFEANIKHLPAHLKQDKNPDFFPPEALAILAKLQQRENEIEGKPFMTYDQGSNGKRGRYPIADREAGALKRLKAIVDARNARLNLTDTSDDFLHFYHQSDPRGCALYLVRHEALKATENMVVRKAVEYGMAAPVKSSETVSNHRPLYESATFPGFVDDMPEGIARRYLREKGISIPNREMLPIDQYYNRGVAVCA